MDLLGSYLGYGDRHIDRFSASVRLVQLGDPLGHCMGWCCSACTIVDRLGYKLGVDKGSIPCYYINIIRKQKEGKMGINRDKIVELVEDGIVDAKDMVTMCAKWMSEDDCAEMLDANELSERFEEDYEDDGQPTWEQEWEDFGECYE